jgi:hypothetical protein
MGRTSMPPPLRAAAAAALVTSKEVEAAVAAVVAATRKAVRSSLRFLELFLVDPDGDEMVRCPRRLPPAAAAPFGMSSTKARGRQTSRPVALEGHPAAPTSPA